MREFLQSVAQFIAASAPHDWSLYLLRNVPGFPPIVQTLHILSVAVVVASIIFINLRVLGWAVGLQQVQEMQRRLLPWFWSALPILFLSGLVFVLARPHRYFLNPVFGIKVASFVAVMLITVVSLWQMNRPANTYSPTLTLKLLSIMSIALWLLIMLAGRWIAYKDYLFPPPM